MNSKSKEFDEKAATWDDDPEHAHRAQVIAEEISKEIPLDTTFTAMEYGCGTGLLSFPLRDRFSRITLVDSSQGMLEVLKEKIKRFNVKNMEVLNVDLLESAGEIPKPFSVIYTAMVLHHIGDIGKIFRIWHSILSRPGYLCVADLDAESGLFHGKDFKGHHGFDRDELRKTSEAAGFANVDFKTVFEIRKESSDGSMRSFPVFLMVARKN